MRLLIVEDDAPLATGLRRILEAEGHAVDVTSRGEQAVLAAAQERFDLVILDIGLPQMDGFEVLRRLRTGSPEKNGPMPVLVLTARDAVDDRVRGLDLGADDYMVKPFAMPELTARVRALLRRSQAHGGPRIVHGPLALALEARARRHQDPHGTRLRLHAGRIQGALKSGSPQPPRASSADAAPADCCASRPRRARRLLPVDRARHR